MQELVQRQNSTNASCDYWHFPVCQIFWKNRNVNLSTSVSSGTLRFDVQPSKKAKNSGGKGSVVMLKSQNDWVPYSRRRSHRRSLFNGRAEIWGQIAPSHSPRAHYTP